MIYRVGRYLYSLLKVVVLLIFLFDRLRRVYRQHHGLRLVLIHQAPFQGAGLTSLPTKATARLYRWIKLVYLLGRSTWG